MLRTLLTGAACVCFSAGASFAASYDYLLGTNVDAPTQVSVFETAQTAAEFYGYNTTRAFSTALPFDLQRERAHAFMHRDTRRGVLSVGFIFNTFIPGPNVVSPDRVKLTVAGAPTGASLSAFDDADPSFGDTRPASPPNGGYGFVYDEARSDGFMLSGFENTGFTLTLDFSTPTDLTSYVLINDSDDDVVFSNGSNRLEFTSEIQPIPAPATGVLLTMGIAVLNCVRRRAAKRTQSA